MAELKNLIVNGSARIIGPLYVDELLLANITYSELKSLRDSSRLIPGKQYRIIDYVTTVNGATPTYTVSNHQFDIIVVADDENHLNEVARAIQHRGDTYFSNSKLETWELKYCLDNDTNRFTWANTSSGKGVIYYMKDEWNNECPYDFKNIMFLRILSDGQLDEESGIDTYVHTFAAFNEDNGTYVDATLLNNTNIDVDGCCCKNNIIKDYYGEEYSLIKLNNIVFLNIYSIDNVSYFECYYNKFGNGCSDNTFGTYCRSNTFGNECSRNTFGDGCNNNTFGNQCCDNTFETYCHSNTFGTYCQINTFGSGCSDNTFGNTCYSNTFGNYCNSNTFGINCENNTLGNQCNYNTFGNNCDSNTFRYYCYSNTFGIGCESNTFGDSCNYNTFGSDCYNIIFGDDCSYNTFGNSCDYIKFSLNAAGTANGNYFQYNVFESGIKYTTLYNIYTASSASVVRYYHVYASVSGLVSTPTKISTARNLNYESAVAKNSSGTVKTGCYADLLLIPPTL